MAYDRAMGSVGGAADTTGSAGWRQYDPGIFTNDSGDYWAQEDGQYKYGGKDPTVFNIGGGQTKSTGLTPDQPQAPPPQTQPPVAVQPSAPMSFAQPDFQAAFAPGASGGLVKDPSASGQALYDLLSKRANQSLSIDPLTDSTIRPQVDAAAAQMTRASRDSINDMAESGSPYSTGALNTAKTQAGESVGQNVSALQTQLVQNELTARRGEIQSALAQEGGMLSQDQQLALQRQLDTINAQLTAQGQQNQLGLGLIGAGIQQQGVTNQNQQYYSGLSQQDQQFLNNLALQYAGLNSSTGLAQQQIDSNNDQFSANYNLNATDRANYWDAIRKGLL